MMLKPAFEKLLSVTARLVTMAVVLSPALFGISFMMSATSSRRLSTSAGLTKLTDAPINVVNLANDAAAQQIMYVAPFSLVEIVMALLFGFLYKQKIVDRIGVLVQQPAANRGFTHTLFGCLDDTQICAYGFCCAAVRNAHNTHVTGVMDFFPSLCATFICPVIYITWAYIEIKKKLGLQVDCVPDVLSACCCSACSICQAAQEIDKAMHVKTSCLFNVEGGALQPPGQTGMQMDGREVV